MQNSQSLETASFPCHFYMKREAFVLVLPLVCHRSCFFSRNRSAIGAFALLAYESYRLFSLFIIIICKTASK